MKQLRWRPQWAGLILGLVLILAISVPLIDLTGYGTFSSSICLSCHSEVEVTYFQDIKEVTQAEQCIEPIQYMRDEHMTLLADWKESVVHQGREFIPPPMARSGK